MENTDPQEKAVWKFSYSARNGKKLEGTFVTCEEEIDWLVGNVIDFGEVLEKDMNTVVRIEKEHFNLVNDDASFVKTFKESMGVVGLSPFEFLDEEQSAEYNLNFGQIYVNGELITPNVPRIGFLDEDERVVTFEITHSVFNPDDGVDPEDELEMDLFLSEFEIVGENSYFLAAEINLFENIGTDHMYVIKRKSDGQLYGYPYNMYRGDSHYDDNGTKYGFDKRRRTYVWFPVEPFTIIGYKLSK